MTDLELRAHSAAKVAEARRRAGLDTAEAQARHHALLQTQVPRMWDWYEDKYARGLLGDHTDLSGKRK